ncbi:MAG TPA: glycosyltransferase [Mycobacteriales bacterium]|nr:glycosyltransferase [Mycobacteriales bacterium]
MRERVVVVIPALNEEQRIGATVAAARTLPKVIAVVVTDDGSTDRTSVVAREAGAHVVRHPRRRGKAAAMVTGAAAARAEGYADAPLLFLDADLEGTAAVAAPLVDPVLEGRADMTIAVLPPAPGGGHGFVVRLATKGIIRATGWTPTQPLSGQRCITPDLFDVVQPLARGFGVETGLTIDALRHGARVLECPVPISHRVTGTSWRDHRHRARQYRDVWLALAARRVRRSVGLSGSV